MSAINIPESLIERIKIATGKSRKAEAVRVALEHVANRGMTPGPASKLLAARRDLARNIPNAATAAALGAGSSKADKTFDTPAEFSKWLRTLPRR